jgi:integrase/recombinase XerD
VRDPIEIDPEGFERRIGQYAQWLKVNHFSEVTAESRASYLKYLVRWCAERGITRPSEVTKLVLERYQAHLYRHRKRSGEPLSLASHHNHLTSIKGLFRWLARQNHLLSNPASELVLPKMSRRLPKHVLSAAEAERVIAMPEVSSPIGLRDRAILEVLYSTGMRRMELSRLKLYDVDRDRGVATIRHGKGRAQRMVPMGRRALSWVGKYSSEARPSLVVPPDEGYLFLTRHGGPFDIDSLTGTVRGYVRRSGVGKEGAVHLFRHTCATLMLEGGADVRYVQAMLGHAKLETTSLYTHVSIRKLQEIHEATHPASARARRKESAWVSISREGGSDVEAEESEPGGR